MSDEPTDELTPERAAAFLAVELTDLRELLQVGALPSHGEGDAQRITLADLQAFAAEQERRRPHMRAINEIGAEQIGHERRLNGD